MSGVRGRSGRKRKPTHLKLVLGTARRSRLNPNEPKPEPERLTPPEHLSAEALEEWRFVVDEYQLGALTKLDRSVLAAYCQAWSRWVRAERTLAQMAAPDDRSKGAMIRTVSGNVIQNPIVGVANKAMADMVRFAGELGITGACAKAG